MIVLVSDTGLEGKLCLSSMSSSRVFLDHDVDPTKEYLNWLTVNPAVASSGNPVEVANVETLTILEIAAFIKRQPSKIAYFDCIATIDDVKLGTGYRVEISVYDSGEHSTFIILGDAGKELTCRKATELIDIYAVENGGDGAELEVPILQCFSDTIGQKQIQDQVSPAVLPPKDHPLDMAAMPISSSQNNPAAT
ncbi:Uncharacterized protein Rs2_04346 [Raphanus sativus]|nr:Uncharacterized protein Rs2_04346 [Raphanus sativus]